MTIVEKVLMITLENMDKTKIDSYGKIQQILKHIGEDIYEANGIFFVEHVGNITFISSSKESRLAIGLNRGEVVALKYYIR